MEENCENCRFGKVATGGGLKCYRYAPAPYNAMVFYVAGLVRDIAWITHVKEVGKPEEDDDDLNKEPTEANDYSVWPEVEVDDWCGEWEPKGGK